jgi:LEA14-like dessication related protein
MKPKTKKAMMKKLVTSTKEAEVKVKAKAKAKVKIVNRHINFHRNLNII